MDVKLFRGQQKFLDGVGVGTATDPFAIAVTLSDGLGNPLSSYYNAETGKYVLNIYDTNNSYEAVNERFSQESATTTTLAVATAATGTDYIITVADATSFLVNDSIHINGHTNNIGISYTILVKVGNVLTLDSKIDRLWPIGTAVVKVTEQLNVAGTLASPQSFKVRANVGQVIHVTRILLAMTHGTAGDLGLFGNLAALTNGIILRVCIDGAFTTFTNWKSNADIKSDMYEVSFDSRSGGGGTYGTSGKGTFSDAGFVVRLDGKAGANGDYLELLVQDTLTGLSYFAVKAQGHVERAV